MVVIGKVGAPDWCAKIVKEIAPAGTTYFSVIIDKNVSQFELAHDAMLGLALTGKGSGVLTIKKMAQDSFFDQPMIGFFV